MTDEFDKYLVNQKFLWACKLGKIEEVRNFLTIEHVKISFQDNYGLRCAARMGHLDVVQYLLTSTEITEHANIHAHNDEPFKSICGAFHRGLLNFFLYNMKFEVNDQLKNHIATLDNMEKVKALIEKRDMFFRLNNELDVKSARVLNCKLNTLEYHMKHDRLKI